MLLTIHQTLDPLMCSCMAQWGLSPPCSLPSFLVVPRGPQWPRAIVLERFSHPANTSYWLGFWAACNSKQLWPLCTNGDLWKHITGRSNSICHGLSEWPLTTNAFLFSSFQDTRSGERTCALIILGWGWPTPSVFVAKGDHLELFFTNTITSGEGQKMILQ